MEKLKVNVRDRFLREYAEYLVDELNAFTEQTGTTHQAQIKAGHWSQVTIKLLQEETPDIQDFLIRMPNEWHPGNHPIIRFQIPDKVLITKPSSTYKDMLE